MGKTQKYLAEALGTFALVGIGSFAILSSAGTGRLDVVAIAFGFGLALLVGLYAFGEVSGGHYNPAVSLGMFLDRRIALGEHGNQLPVRNRIIDQMDGTLAGHGEWHE